MRWLRLVLGGVIIGLIAAGAVTVYRVHEETQNVPDTQKLARTLEIIRTSTPSDRKALKVLFYGQSITKSGWDAQVQQHWKERYPNTIFVVRNLAIGGFPTQDLERTTARDIADFYPDLIIFHDYGDHRAYARIIRMFRSQTAADILIQTDHGDTMPDPVCREGLAWNRPAGCAGRFWVHQREWHDEMSYHKIPALGRKYGLAVEPQRQWWRDYLLRNSMQPEALLADIVHPNDAGKVLIASFFNQYFDGIVDAWKGEQGKAVTVVPSVSVVKADGSQTLRFKGTRLEIVTHHFLEKPDLAWIDGVNTFKLPGCYNPTRATELDTGRDWPAVRRVELVADHTPEEWTATLSHFTADDSDFDFTLTGSESGDQGSGRASNDFVSKSGALKIAAIDWMPARAFQETKVPLSDPFVVKWAVTPICGVQPQIAGSTYRYVIAAGLSPGYHVAQFAGTPDGQILIYEPSPN
jgi:hypothetical protein